MQKRIWDRFEPGAGPEALAQVIDRLEKADHRFHMEGGSWTSDISWVRGYENVLGPMEAASSLFSQKVLERQVPTSDPRYRNALFHLLSLADELLPLLGRRRLERLRPRTLPPHHGHPQSRFLSRRGELTPIAAGDGHSTTHFRPAAFAVRSESFLQPMATSDQVARANNSSTRDTGQQITVFEMATRRSDGVMDADRQLYPARIF